MTLTNLVGRVGSGKTLFMTADAVNSDRSRILSNYAIQDDRYEDLLPEMLMDKALHDANILLDEVYAWLESRTSGKDINRYMSYILFQGRKKDIDFYMTEQLLSSVDLRYRDLIDYTVKCKAIPNYKNPIGFKYIIIDELEQIAYPPMFLPIAEAAKYFHLYDSYQPISPIDDEMMLKISKNKVSIIEIVDSIVDTLLNEGMPGKIKKGVIADYCLRNGYPKSYVDMAWNALLRRQANASV